MGYPVGYLLTWVCYGSWLHGDARGSVDAGHNVYGTPFLPPDPVRAARERGEVVGGGVLLDAPRRAVVEDTIRRHCEIRKWRLPAVHVRTNHVHAVVSASRDPDAVLGQLKAWTTRRLREEGLTGQAEEVWAEGGSTRYLWDHDQVARAVRYVLEGQGSPL